jgi:hypothetical protein
VTSLGGQELNFEVQIAATNPFEEIKPEEQHKYLSSNVEISQKFEVKMKESLKSKKS